MDPDWLSMFLSVINWKLYRSKNIDPLCCYHYSCGMDSALLFKLE